MNHQPAPQTQTDSETLKGIFQTIGLLLLAPVIAIFLTMFVFHSYVVDGPSMETTLQNNDRLLVLKLPRTWARITGNAYIPNRGDVIVFNHDETSSYQGGGKKQLIKRVIGLPGERIVVKDGSVTVYNQEHPEGFSPDKTMSYGSVIKTSPGEVDLTIPEGEVFVMGDNRMNSLDSPDFGPVRASDIVGKLSLRVYPLNKTTAF